MKGGHFEKNQLDQPGTRRTLATKERQSALTWFVSPCAPWRNMRERWYPAHATAIVQDRGCAPRTAGSFGARSSEGGSIMDLGIGGRRALVCASSRGLGRGCATALAAEGVHVTLTGLDAESLARTA